LTVPLVRALRRRPLGTDNPIPFFNTQDRFWDCISHSSIWQLTLFGMRVEWAWKYNQQR
jgi:hypothetical protein